MSFRSRFRLTAWLLALPALIVLALQLVPLASAFRTALTNEHGQFTLQHVVQVYHDPLFLRAVRFNLLIPLASVAIEAVAGVGMALWFHELRRGKSLWRTVALVPFALPEIVYLLTMKLVFRQHGYLNSLIVSLAGNNAAIGWLSPGSPLAVAVLIAVDAWRVTPLVFLIVLAALEQMPESYLDAARVDGASRWQLIWLVQIPLVLPALLVALAIRAVDAFRIFATPLVLVGVQQVPVLTSVAYHYKVEANDPAAANVAALTLAVALLLGTALALGLARRHTAQGS
ncbi:MAG: sugar ABC transporter permease [Calditrichaeota bacterium]|nr:sugar ABC transporter permease [Calditrichota bacterium]